MSTSKSGIFRLLQAGSASNGLVESSSAGPNYPDSTEAIMQDTNIPIADAVKLQPVADPACWHPKEFFDSDRWIVQLKEPEIEWLLSWAKSVRKTISDDPQTLLHLPADAYDLGEFTPKIHRVFSELQDGSGVVLLRGLPIDDMELIDAACIYWAIGRHLGTACPNNPEGDIFGHITDLGKTQRDANSRGYQTREAMDYHCDQCDIVGLLCIRTAKTGGISKLASSVAVYNQLLKENQQFVEVLCEPFYWTKHGEHPAHEQPFYNSPVFNFLNGKLCTSFGPKHIIKGHDLPDTPDISSLQIDALTRAEEIADELHIEMELQSGDMQFANNYVVLHTRTAYLDHQEPDRKRLLWRLWLMNEHLRARTDYVNQWAHGVATGTANARIRLS